MFLLCFFNKLKIEETVKEIQRLIGKFDLVHKHFLGPTTSFHHPYHKSESDKSPVAYENETVITEWERKLFSSQPFKYHISPHITSFLPLVMFKCGGQSRPQQAVCGV